jgi:hypothetical protein
MLEFNDGVSFDLQSKPHIEFRFDGIYVCGGGSLIPVNSRQEADEVLKEELADYERHNASI